MITNMCKYTYTDGPDFEPRWKRGFLFTTPIWNGTGAHAATCKMGNGASSRMYSDRGVTVAIHHASFRLRGGKPLLPPLSSAQVKGNLYLFYIYTYLHRGA
jgi:nitrite reductase/ring-hydroxylating ferredoxin subunit